MDAIFFPRQMIAASTLDFLRAWANNEARHLVWFVTVALPALFRALWATWGAVKHLVRYTCSDHYRNAYNRTRGNERAKARVAAASKRRK
jgi:hypothetical protein